MNFQTSPVLRPVRVLMINPLSPAAKLVIVKIMSGKVFGSSQLVDLTLLVYSNERPVADELTMELYNCAFACMNSIVVSSDLPVISDADVFCFITNFKNPNAIDITQMDNDLFDILYLIIKIGNTLLKPEPIVEEPGIKPKKKNVIDEKPWKPIVMTDGLVTMNILMYLLKDIPSDIIFCPTPLSALAKSVLGDQLEVRCNIINDILVWAANDEVFHIEVEKPLIIHDRVGNENNCDWDMIGKDLLKSIHLDHTQFNDSWLKKEYKDKVAVSASKNPYGYIYRAAEFARTLQIFWKARTANDGKKTYANMGVISDGSLHTIKGRAYVLPLVLMGENWAVNKRFEESSHLQQEIQRINKSVKSLYEKLNPFCKKFLEENVLKLAFLPAEDNESGSNYSFDYYTNPTNDN